MTTDITFCANHEKCSAKDFCLRGISDFVKAGLIAANYQLWYAEFQPEKGRDCRGFKQATSEETN